MSRHLSLDPRQPPAPVTMPRQGQPPGGAPAGTVASQGFPVTDAVADLSVQTSAEPAAGTAAAAGPAPAPVGRRSARRGKGEQRPAEQSLPTLRPAARHHSGVEHRRLRKSRPARSPKQTAPRGIGLSKALVALLASALVAALAGAWAYHSWSGNRALSRSGSGAAKAPLVVLDGVADTGDIQFTAGHTQQVQVSVENRNAQPISVQGIEPGKVVLSEPVPPGCTASMVKAVAEHSDLVVPPGDGVFDATVAMSAAAPPDCNGIAFSVTFVVTGTVTTA